MHIQTVSPTPEGGWTESQSTLDSPDVIVVVTSWVRFAPIISVLRQEKLYKYVSYMYSEHVW